MITEDTVDAIATLGAKSEQARFRELPNGRVVHVREMHGQNGCDFVIDEVQAPKKDDHGHLLATPSRIVKSVTLQTADALVDYTNRFKTGGAALFANIDADIITAALDYHTDATTTGHASHHATLNLPKSEEWKIWTEQESKGLIPQLEFARFLRENNADIRAPAAADLLELVQDLQAVRNVNFTKAVRLDSENESFEYVDNTEAKGKGGVSMPDRFTLSIPVYFNGRYVELGAFLKWKLMDGNLLLGVTLHRKEHVRQAVFKEIVEDVAARTEVPAYYATYNRN